MTKYKGYQAQVEFDDENEIFHGEVIGIRDVITFQGKSVSELKKAMKESIDDYLEWCKERKKEPNKPYSGNFIMRVNPELHQSIAFEAKKSGKSMNTWVTSVLEKTLKTKNPRKTDRKKAKLQMS